MKRKHSKWIHVTEALPGLHENVIVTADMSRYLEEHGEGCEGAFVTTGYLDDDYRWQIMDMCQFYVVTAWMPYPDPYFDDTPG